MEKKRIDPKYKSGEINTHSMPTINPKDKSGEIS